MFLALLRLCQTIKFINRKKVIIQRRVPRLFFVLLFFLVVVRRRGSECIVERWIRYAVHLHHLLSLLFFLSHVLHFLCVQRFVVHFVGIDITKVRGTGKTFIRLLFFVVFFIPCLVIVREIVSIFFILFFTFLLVRIFGSTGNDMVEDPSELSTS